MFRDLVARLQIGFLRKHSGEGRRPIPVDVLTGYAAWAKNYPAEAHNVVMEIEQQAMLDLLPGLLDGKACLDLACGSGRYMRLMRQRRAEVVFGLDGSPDMLDQAMKNGLSGFLTRSPFSTLPFADEMFDLITCGLAIGHTADLSGVLRAAARVLRSGGSMLYSDIHPFGALSGWQRTFTAGDGTIYSLEHHPHLYSAHQQACEAAGLIIDAVREPVARPGQIKSWLRADCDRYPGRKSWLALEEVHQTVFSRGLYFDNVTVLDAEGIVGHSIRVKGRRILAIDGAPGRNDRIIDCQGGRLIPGLINAHDHLEFNTFKRLRYRDRYSHAVQWIEDIEAKFDTDPDLIEPRLQPLADRLTVSAVKNLLSGVTTVCHHNPFHRQLRRGYPVRVVKDYGFCHSLFRGEEPDTSYSKTKLVDPWLIHLAEGIDGRAEAEFEQLNRLGLVRANTVLVHGVGLTAGQRRVLAEGGGGLVWCPGSNFFMFGQTAQVKDLARARKLALGSDSRLSGEVDLLAELRLAAQTQQLSPQQLFRAVTTDAARVLRLRRGGCGRIRVDGEADLVLVPASSAPDPYLSILSLRRAQLELVMLAGKPLIASVRLRPVFEATRTRFAPVFVDQAEKLMALKLVNDLKHASVREAGVIVRQQGTA